jgi:Cu2+-exporting ATPase
MCAGSTTPNRPLSSRPSPEKALATVAGRRLAVGNARLLEREQVAFDGSRPLAEEIAGEGRTVVHVAVDGEIAGLIAVADAPRDSAHEAITALNALRIRPVMLTGDNRATAERIAAALGIDEVIAEVLPAEEAAKVGELQRQGRRVAMVGDGVNDAPALAQANVGIAIGAGTDVAIETADVVLMRSDPLDVATAVQIGRGTVRKMHQNLDWAIGYNSLALPIAAGVFEPFGFRLRPAIGAISMSGSRVLVAVTALALKRLRLPRPDGEVSEHQQVSVQRRPGFRARKLDRRDEEQVVPGRLVDEHLDERSFGLCTRGVELDRLVQLAGGKTPEEHEASEAGRSRRC